jgi:choline dehydrogenase-like flavoprotein
VLGGSSSINGLIYIRGQPEDFDHWAQLGNRGWGWDDVLPYFKRAENWQGEASELRGSDGFLTTSPMCERPAACQAIIEAGKELGLEYRADVNNLPLGAGDSIGWCQQTRGGRRRASAARTYLRPASKRPNLQIVTQALVRRVLFDGTRAVAVEFSRNGAGSAAERADAACEVILSAGAIGSPHLLLLSGIGAPDELRAAGVEPRHELPGVGRNLQDHPFVTIIWEVSDPDTLRYAERPQYLAEWTLRRSGPLTSTVAEVVAFVRTRPGLPAADIQFHMGAAYYEDHGQETYDGHCAVIAPVLVSPQARGRVWLRSADPTAKPRIVTNSLSEPDDVRSLVDGMLLAREIAAQPPLAEAVVRELKPGPGLTAREDLEADLRRRLMLIYHPVGTCRMSDHGEDAVVDSQLRVHGLQGLRVVDASVMPVIPGGNTNAPTIMIAERAADLIR